MIAKLLKAAAYAKAPKATFMVLHPVKSAQLKHLKYDMKHAYSPRVAAVGAAALALPLGMLLGRLGRGRSNGQ